MKVNYGPSCGIELFPWLVFRGDTEVPIKAVTDYLCSRRDVGQARIAAYGSGEPGAPGHEALIGGQTYLETLLTGGVDALDNLSAIF